MAGRKVSKSKSFVQEAAWALTVPIAHRASEIGGYGANGEVIYEGHPTNCPSVLVDNQRDATATFMSNGALGFEVKQAGTAEVAVLDVSFDFAEKREIGVPAANVWIDVRAGRERRIASIINPKSEMNSPPAGIRLVKLGDPRRALWYGAFFRPAPGVSYETAVKCSLVYTPAGPALRREVCVKNTGKKSISGLLWTFYFLHGTQRFVYNKQLWYDISLPLSNKETVVAATVPYSDMVQIKRVSSDPQGMKAVDATCDYATFIGDTSVFSIMPEAVRRGAMLPGGAGRKLNRFSTAAVAANQFEFALRPGQAATLGQALLYVTDQAMIDRFRETSSYSDPSYGAMTKAFRAAAKELVAIPLSLVGRGQGEGKGSMAVEGRAPHPPLSPEGRGMQGESPASSARAPAFQVALPNEPVVANYANSAWTGIKELYEKCRAHGAKLADGIELGTRDRAQDMWPKMKEDPGRVRADLVHALGFMYVTQDPGKMAMEQNAAGRAPTPGGDRGGVGAAAAGAEAGPFSPPLTLPQKLHGMFPRQYPSQWSDRRQEIMNDNRPYADSPLWLLDALWMYLRETGDASILRETVTTVRLANVEDPVHSGIVGCDRRQTVLETVCEVFECFGRHVLDSPYGMAQVLYGDWCDPLDMFGTSVVGDATTRGRGRGVCTRLSAHLFLCLVDAIDCLAARPVREVVDQAGLAARVEALMPVASELRKSIVRFAWEDGDRPFLAGFIDWIHELKADGSRPDYAKGELGYTCGSMRGADPDGVLRRSLVAQAYGLAMLTTDRDYLEPVPGSDAIVARILETTDKLFFRDKLGLLLFSRPIANDQRSVEFFGRMGIVPSGCAENGEYHHGQVMMHRYRMRLAGQADTAWREFKPVMSALRDESRGGPFETPCTSCASDPADPHFGQGMYFGLSGSTDWIVEVFHEVAGLRLALHDPDQPAVRVTPNLPATLKETLTFRRLIHLALPEGGYRPIPLTIDIRRSGAGRTRTATEVKVNGQPVPEPAVRDLAGLDRVHMEITYVYG